MDYRRALRVVALIRARALYARLFLLRRLHLCRTPGRRASRSRHPEQPVARLLSRVRKLRSLASGQDLKQPLERLQIARDHPDVVEARDLTGDEVDRVLARAAIGRVARIDRRALEEVDRV